MTETSQAIERDVLPAAAIDRVGSRELEDLVRSAAAQGIDVLPLEGGPRLPLEAHVRAAAESAFDDARPQHSQGAPELREAIRATFRAETGADTSVQNIVVTNGAMQGLNLLFRAMLAPGDNVVVPTPNFFFTGAVELAGGVPRFVQSGYDRESGWQPWDPVAVERAIDSRTRAIVFSNPVNPTGYVPSREVLTALLDVAERHGTYLVSDESYDRFVYDGPFTPLASCGDSEFAVVVRSFSKAFALAPWRVGYLVAAERLASVLVKILEWESLYVADVAQRIATAALSGSQAWLQPLLGRYRESRDSVWRAVNDNGTMSCALPAGSPFVFVDVSSYISASVDPVAAFLSLGIPTIAGGYFGAPGFVRLPFGGPPDVIARLVERVADVGLKV